MNYGPNNVAEKVYDQREDLYAAQQEIAQRMKAAAKAMDAPLMSGAVLSADQLTHNQWLNPGGRTNDIQVGNYWGTDAIAMRLRMSPQALYTKGLSILAVKEEGDDEIAVVVHFKGKTSIMTDERQLFPSDCFITQLRLLIG